MVNALKAVGFFSDLTYGYDDEPTLAASMRLSGEEWEADAIRYLGGGTEVAAALMWSYDVLDPEHPAIGPLRVRTDGGWAWPSDLAHYLARYHVALPDEFVAEMRKRDWHAPEDVEISGDEFDD